MDNNTIEKVKQFIKTQFDDCKLESEDKKESKKVLKGLKVPEDSFFYYYYSNYDAGEIYCDERTDERTFYEMLYYDSLEEEFDYIKSKFKMPTFLIPITSTEGDGCIFYNIQSGEVADVSFDQFTDLENGTFHPQWPSFEDYLIDFLNIRP